MAAPKQSVTAPGKRRPDGQNRRVCIQHCRVPHGPCQVGNGQSSILLLGRLRRLHPRPCGSRERVSTSSPRLARRGGASGRVTRSAEESPLEAGQALIQPVSWPASRWQADSHQRDPITGLREVRRLRPEARTIPCVLELHVGGRSPRDAGPAGPVTGMYWVSRTSRETPNMKGAAESATVWMIAGHAHSNARRSSSGVDAPVVTTKHRAPAASNAARSAGRVLICRSRVRMTSPSAETAGIQRSSSSDGLKRSL